MAEKIIDIKHLQKHFGDLQVLNDVDFNVDKGEVVTVIGSSGSGKSTLLRCINLLEIPDGGEIVFEGQDREILLEFVYQVSRPLMENTISVCFG